MGPQSRTQSHPQICSSYINHHHHHPALVLTQKILLFCWKHLCLNLYTGFTPTGLDYDHTLMDNINTCRFIFPQTGLTPRDGNNISSVGTSDSCSSISHTVAWLIYCSACMHISTLYVTYTAQPIIVMEITAYCCNTSEIRESLPRSSSSSPSPSPSSSSWLPRTLRSSDSVVLVFWFIFNYLQME